PSVTTYTTGRSHQGASTYYRLIDLNVSVYYKLTATGIPYFTPYRSWPGNFNSTRIFKKEGTLITDQKFTSRKIRIAWCRRVYHATQRFNFTLVNKPSVLIPFAVDGQLTSCLIGKIVGFSSLQLINCNLTGVIYFGV